MAAKNDITGDEIKSKSSTKAYEDNWDRIFGKKEKTSKERLDNYTDGYPNDKQFESDEDKDS
jgi:hypothetical protein